MLNIIGKFNTVHILRALIAQEYAFFFIIKGKETKIAHNRGTWRILHENTLLEIDDNGEFKTDNSLLKGLVEAKKELIKWDDSTRLGVATLITSILEIWINNLKEIEKIVSMQAGRNAIFDPYTKEFLLDPEILQWKT